MIKEMIIPTTIALTLGATPLMAADSAGAGGSKADRQTPESMNAEAAVIQNEREFDELDTNKDGSLDENELNAWGSTAAGPENSDKHTDQVLERYDHNNDHRVTMEELQERSVDSDDADYTE